MRRRLVRPLAVAALAAAALTTAAARPALARSRQSAGARCSAARCSAEAGIVLGGPAAGHSGGVNLSGPAAATPPCWMAPTFTQAQMDAFAGRLPRVLSANHVPSQQRAQMDGYVAEVYQNRGRADGMWWTRESLDTPAGLACLGKLPLWVWARRGAAPPARDSPLTPADLAKIARASLTVPRVRIRLSPAGTDYVGLPTFLRTTRPLARVWVTATAPGYLTVTVTATPGRFVISPGGPGRAYADCGPSGSRYPLTSAPVTTAGPGARPDCGVVYQAPSTSAPSGFTLRVTVSWQVTWHVTWSAPGGAAPGGAAGGPLADIGQTTSQRVRVAEIQSVGGF